MIILVENNFVYLSFRVSTMGTESKLFITKFVLLFFYLIPNMNFVVQIFA